MRLISKTEMQKKTDRELSGLKEELRKGVGNCDQQRRRGQAALADVRAVQGQRRILRPNL